jgi:hypothetical protein
MQVSFDDPGPRVMISGFDRDEKLVLYASGIQMTKFATTPCDLRA